MEGEERVCWLILVLRFIFLPPPQQLAATKKHLADLVKLYGEQTLVNLVDHKGYERPVKEAYEKTFSQVGAPCGILVPPTGNLTSRTSSRFQKCSTSTLISTPSAGTCGGIGSASCLTKSRMTSKSRGKWLCIAAGRQSPTVRRYFFLNSETDDVKLQGGAVRTNCMDNLDRTNVAQAAIAKYVLTKQLREVGTFGENETVDDHEGLSTAFRESRYPPHSPSLSA